MNRFSFLITPCLLMAVISFGQNSVPEELSYYGDVMTNAALPEHRQHAGDRFLEIFSNNIMDASTAWSALDSIPWIQVVTSQDSALTIVTWQVDGKEGAVYYGSILFPQLTGRSPIALRDTRPLNSEVSAYRPDQWYGALYYGIQDFLTTDGGTVYLLLGFNADTPQLNQRVADVLSLTDSSAVFGMPVFQADSASSNMKSRILLEYADAAAGTMRFDRDKMMLIYDHVIPVDTPEGTTLVPDGSYYGYQYHEGTWSLIDKVFTKTVDTPPGGRQEETIKRDLFGRPVEKHRD